MGGERRWKGSKALEVAPNEASLQHARLLTSLTELTVVNMKPKNLSSIRCRLINVAARPEESENTSRVC